MESPSQDELVCLYLDAVDERTNTPPGAPVGDAEPSTAATGPTRIPPRTVQGIATALELDRATTAEQATLLSTLDDLVARNLARTETTATTGTTRTAYRLTHAGRQRATAVRERVRGREVTALEGESGRSTDGETDRAVPVGETDPYFETYPLVRTLSRVREDGRLPIEPTFVGRESERQRLREAATTTKKRGGQTVLVSGEAGVGKTALVERLLVDAREEGFRIARGQCRPTGDRPFGPLVSALGTLPKGDEVVAPLETAADYDPEDPDALDAERTALFNDVADGIRGRAHDQPLVIFLDDLQWAGEDTRTLFAHLARSITGWVNPVLFVATVRTDSNATDPKLDALLEEELDAERTERVHLEGLTGDETGRLVTALTGYSPTDEELDDLRESTGGNPQSIRETVQRLVDERRLPDDRSGASVEGRPDPDRDQGAVDAAPRERLASLADDTREVLEAAAVAGRTVPPELLATVLGEPVATINDHLDVLVAGRFLERTRDGVVFVGGVVREAVLEDVAEKRRRTLHTAVADAIESGDHGTGGRWGARVGHHREAAGDRASALEQYREAGEYARRRYAHETAVDAWKRALAIAEEIGDVTVQRELLETLGETNAVLGRYERAREHLRAGIEATSDLATRQRLVAAVAETRVAEEDYEAAIEAVRNELAESDAGEEGGPVTAAAADLQSIRAEALAGTGAIEAARTAARSALDRARATEDPERETRALRRMGTIAQDDGAYVEASEHLESCLAIARERGDRSTAADVLDELGHLAYHQGEFETASEYHRESLQIYRELGSRRGEATALKNLGHATRRRGDLERATEFYEQSLETHRTIGDRKGEGDDLNSLGIVAYTRGDLDAAQKYYQDCLTIYREIGYATGEGMGLNNLGRIALFRGDLERAREYFAESLAVHREADDHLFEPTNVFNLGQVAYERGDLATAREHFEESLDLFRDIENRAREARLLANLGKVALEEGDLDDAETYVEESLSIARSVDQPDREGEALIVRGTVATERGALDRAAEDVRDGLSIVRDADSQNFEIDGLLALGGAERRRGNPKAAAEAYDGALTIASENGFRLRTLDALEALARIAREEGNDAVARRHCQEALDRIDDSDADAVTARADAFQSLLAAIDSDDENGDR